MPVDAPVEEWALSSRHKPGGTAMAEAGGRDGIPKPGCTYLHAAPNKTSSLKRKTAGTEANVDGTGLAAVGRAAQGRAGCGPGGLVLSPRTTLEPQQGICKSPATRQLELVPGLHRACGGGGGAPPAGELWAGHAASFGCYTHCAATSRFVWHREHASCPWTSRNEAAALRASPRGHGMPPPREERARLPLAAAPERPSSPFTFQMVRP